MTKSELIEILSARQGHLKADDVDLAVKSLLEMMGASLVGGRTHRNPRLRQLLAALPSAAPGPQPEDGRFRRAARASTSRISSRQGTARTRQRRGPVEPEA
jgi:hypothetical protein